MIIIHAYMCVFCVFFHFLIYNTEVLHFLTICHERSEGLMVVKPRAMSPTPIGHHRNCTCGGGAARTHHQTRAGPEAVQTCPRITSSLVICITVLRYYPVLLVLLSIKYYPTKKYPYSYRRNCRTLVTNARWLQ